MSSGRRVVLASNNPGKLREIKAIFRDLDFELAPQSDFNVPGVAETGDSFLANALLKARHAARHCGLPAMADDSGIEVDVLDGAPGIYSARYAGAGASDEANVQLLLRNVAATGAQKPAARFKCAMVYVRSEDDPAPVIAEGSWKGFIVAEPKGKNGFGYDPVFYVPDHHCTSAQLPPDVKNRISHRARALHELCVKLKALYPDGDV